MSTMSLPHHAEATVMLPAGILAVFDWADDHARLVGHMDKPSLMMGGGYMTATLDAARFRAVGARLGLQGRAFGLPLHADTIVSERTPPLRKVWETVGEPRLWVIGAYRMGVDLTPLPHGCALRVFIDYAPPTRRRWLGAWLGSAYARWCVEHMSADARAFFSGD